jgi:hypothetical protein
MRCRRISEFRTRSHPLFTKKDGRRFFFGPGPFLVVLPNSQSFCILSLALMQELNTEVKGHQDFTNICHICGFAIYICHICHTCPYLLDARCSCGCRGQSGEI